MPNANPILRLRGRVAYLSRKDLSNPNPGALTAARHDLAEAMLERAILQVIESQPPLSASRRTRLAELLVGGAR